MRSNAALSGNTGKTKLKWHWSFFEDGLFFSKIHSCKKKRAAFQFWNVQCSVYSEYNPFGKYIWYLWQSVLISWRVPQINQWMGNTGHCYKSNGHNLSDNNNNNNINKNKLIFAVKCRPIIKRHELTGCRDNKCHEEKV